MDENGHHSMNEYEPSRHDVEDQIGKNESYIFELKLAHSHLLTITMYWALALSVSTVIAISLAFLLFLGTRSISWLTPTTIVEQTIVATLLVLMIFAAVFSFYTFVYLRQLASEAFEVAEANRASVRNAVRLLDKIA